MGVTRAWVQRDISSREMKNGIVRSGSILLVVWTLYWCVPEDFYIALNFILTGFISSNMISIFENLHGIGVKVPFGIVEKLRLFDEQINKTNEGDKNED